MPHETGKRAGHPIQTARAGTPVAPSPTEGGAALTERSLAELLSHLLAEFTTLLRQEVHLARVEVGQTLAEVGRNVALMTGGGLLIYAALGVRLTNEPPGATNFAITL
ncbi:MAG: phage holin family protein [Ardenticatenales bacterium]|nr:phage holin family protein [Ardenticatenales bacterium]